MRTLAFAISWVTYVVRITIAWPDPIDQTLRLIVKFGPSLAGLIAGFVVAGFAGLRDILRRLLPIGVKLRWISFALLVPALVFGAALLIRRSGLLLGTMRSELRGAAGN